jgi:hypothetical protein
MISDGERGEERRLEGGLRAGLYTISMYQDIASISSIRLSMMARDRSGLPLPRARVLMSLSPVRIAEAERHYGGIENSHACGKK